MKRAFLTFFSAAMIITVFGLGMTTPATAQEGAIKHRKAIMKAVGGHMGAMASILKGHVPFKDDLKGHAHAMAELSKIAGRVFPEGSDFGETRALEVIWEKPEEFKKALTAFQTEAATLAQVSKSGDKKSFFAQFKKLGGACGGCHKKFRKKLQK